MNIVASSRYEAELNYILDFISRDSPVNALSFAKKLDMQIANLLNFPYKHRQSIKSKDENVRDFVFSGYVIPYRINQKLNRIELLGIFNQNEWEL